MLKRCSQKIVLLTIVVTLLLSLTSQLFTLDLKAQYAWGNYEYFEVTQDDLEVYDNRSGKLELIGTLNKGQVYPINLDYGNWHRIQMGNYYGYVLKSGTKPAQANRIQNENKSYSLNGKAFTVTKDSVVYDNTSGKLVPFATLNKGTKGTIATDYGNWWRVIIGGRVGYLLKADVSVTFGASDKYFTVTQEKLEVYDNRSGSLKLIGNLEKGQVFPRVSDYGNWHKIQFGDYYGYVLKSGTTYSDGTGLKNENKEFDVKGNEFTVTNETVVYDNTSGKLVPFALLKSGTKGTIATDYGNWWRVIIGGKVGYLLKKDVKIAFTAQDDYFTVTKDNLEVYDNRSGKLELVGTLTKGQEYPRVSDYGNWHKIQFGNYYGYVLKSGTKFTNGSSIKNKNTSYQTNGREFTVLKDTTVYDNTSGKLVPFASIKKGSKATIASDYGNWWRIVIADKVGYVLKEDVSVSFTASDQYFMVTKEQLPVYDNRKGYLDLIGYLEKGQIYPRVSDYGNWHQIQVGNYYGYVLKSGTTLSSGLGLRNENKEYPTTGRELTVIRETEIYDNTSGKLVSFGVLKPGVKVNIATDFGNWWRIVHGGKVGYILKDNVQVGFASDDKYFRTIKDNVPVYDNRTGKLVKIAELPLGAEYKRISDYGNWHQIQVNDHFGYVLKSDTSLTYGENIVNESSNMKGEYIRISPSDNVKIYESTSTSAKYFAVLEKDKSYQVIDINNNWYIVLFGNRIGYISRNDLTENRYYDYSLSKMVDVQMTRSPQTDKYRNEPAFVHSSTVTETTNWVILGSGVALRTEPTTAGGTSTVVARLNSGTRVEFIGEVTGGLVSGSNRWYQVKYNNQILYVHSLYLSNGASLSTNSNVNVRSQTNTNSHVYTQLAVNSNIAATKTVTGQVVSGSDKWYQINIGTWRLPTRADLEAYVNPNLQDSFQFLDLSKRSNITQSQIKSILIGNGILEGKEASFIKAGEKYGVNEVYLISHARLETGLGKSQLATGVKVGKNSSGSPVLVTEANEKNLKEIKTVYNMYGIAAYDSSPLSSGAIHAYKNGWTTPDIAIVEGAKFVKSSYIDRGQTTLYKMRWNPDNPGQHQYATDIGWAAKQVTHIKNLYEKISNPTINLEFPVYK